MNFRSLNSLNIRANFLSGNLLPLESGDSHILTRWKLYGVLMWLVQVVQVSVLIPGLVMVPWEKVLMDGLVTVVVTIEAVFMIWRIYGRRELVDQLIRGLDDILCVENETMKNVVKGTLRPMKIPLKFYWVSGSLSVFLWCCLPFWLLLKKESFRYEDYRVPAIFSKQPFSTEVFLLGSILLLVGNVCIFWKKSGVDIYMIHLVMMITAQYRYTAKKLAEIFRDANLQSELEESRLKIDRWVQKEIRALCRHYITVLRLSCILKELLSLSFSMIYVNSVLRFCFIGIMLSTTLTTVSLESLVIFMFTCGSIMQFYILCSCVQQLHDASKELTDEAFHEKWYQFGSSVKRTFMLMIQSCNLDRKISTNDKFNLSLPSFMTILNQSYSIAILLL